jgi:hypothetical protein
LFQQPLLLAVGLVVLVIGTPSETGMREVEEDRFFLDRFYLIGVPDDS